MDKLLSLYYFRLSIVLLYSATYSYTHGFRRILRYSNKMLTLAKQARPCLVSKSEKFSVL